MPGLGRALLNPAGAAPRAAAAAAGWRGRGGSRRDASGARLLCVYREDRPHATLTALTRAPRQGGVARGLGLQASARSQSGAIWGQPWPQSKAKQSLEGRAGRPRAVANTRAISFSRPGGPGRGAGLDSSGGTAPHRCGAALARAAPVGGGIGGPEACGAHTRDARRRYAYNV